MAQLTVYIDEQTRKQIGIAPKNANSSVSQWIVARITEALQKTWPQNYFDLFGSLRGSNMERPPELCFEGAAIVSCPVP